MGLPCFIYCWGINNSIFVLAGTKLVSLQKGVNKERFEVSVFRKTDLEMEEEGGGDGDEEGGGGEGDASSHTLEELKQINHQLYKYSLKHILNSR